MPILRIIAQEVPFCNENMAICVPQPGLLWASLGDDGAEVLGLHNYVLVYWCTDKEINKLGEN